MTRLKIRTFDRYFWLGISIIEFGPKSESKRCKALSSWIYKFEQVSDKSQLLEDKYPYVRSSTAEALEKLKNKS